jgi:hypothetical protein
MTKDNWTPTRHGGFRRTRTGVAQKTGTTREASREAEGRARSNVEDGVGDVQYLVERRSDKAEVGGSNPSPGTSKKFILAFNERLGLPSCPYVIRWRLETPWFSIRLHHWLAPDDDRAPHDHPWNFTTFVLLGGYTDESTKPCDSNCGPVGHVGGCAAKFKTREHLRAPAIRRREAAHQHTVFPDPDGAWTIIVTGPKVRSWGFWVKGKFVKMNKYFLTHGHHPCE